MASTPTSTLIFTFARPVFAALRALPAQSPYAVLIPPTDGGSLGDQAMLDALVGRFAARGLASTVLFPGPGIPDLPLRGTTRFVTPQGQGLRRRLWDKPLFGRAHAAVLVGADVLDGVYGGQASLNRLRQLRVAQRLGIPVTVSGSSMSETPAPEVVAFLRDHPALPVLARDPVSQGRFVQALGREVALVADLAFLLRPALEAPAARAAADWIAGQRAAGREVLAVNVSGHTLERMHGAGVRAHVDLLGQWLDGATARAVIFIPHDVRPAPVGDLEPLAALFTALAPRFADRLHLLRPPFEAWDVKALAGLVDLVMTGRMHFAIAALGMGTPPLCVVYQGKFEGLMAHFGLDGLLMTPDEILDTPGTLARLAAILAGRGGIAAAIAAALPRVTALSERNFDFLGPA